ncbi:hypothetical protein OIV83_004752 [Microbotryomycetes sp. JL201]|nr:hypothetical protein OIV83_004752 [Microbotryomycetes sp. JL201]
MASSPMRHSTRSSPTTGGTTRHANSLEHVEYPQTRSTMTPSQGKWTSDSSPKAEVVELQDVTPLTTRPSPRSMSLNGSAVMTDLLEMHPHFSVFRKNLGSSSLVQETSGHDDKPKGGGGGGDGGVSESSLDCGNVFNQSTELVQAAAANSSSESWHLSEADTSLRFGDSDTSDSLAQRHTTGTNTTAMASTESVRLVNLEDFESPPQSKSRQSSGRTGKTPRSMIQFSPLSIAPSPLLSTSLPPRPVYASLDTTAAITKLAPEAPLSVIKTILKAPRTPGTGRSVRFSASTNASNLPSLEASPVSITQFRRQTPAVDASFDYSADLVEVEQSFGDDEPSSIVEGGSHTGATFLSKLQAAIPSPDSSLVHAYEQNSDISSSNIQSGQVSALVHEQESDALTIVPTAGPGQASAFLFDESNPFAGQESVSLAQSTATSLQSSANQHSSCRIDSAARLEQSASSAWSASPISTSGTPRHGTARVFEASPTVRLPFIEAITTGGLSAGEKGTIVDASADSTSNNMTTFAHNPPLADVSASNSEPDVAHSDSVASDRADNTFPALGSKKQGLPRRNSSSSFYRMFLERRAKESTVAADELERIVSSESGQETTTADITSARASLAQDQGSDSDDEQEHASLADHDKALNMSVYGTPKSEKSLRVDDTTMYYSPEPQQHDGVDEARCEVIEEHVSDQPGGDSFDADSLLPVAIDGQETQVHDGDLLPTFLSPIAEMSEPNTTVSSMSAYAESPFALHLETALPHSSKRATRPRGTGQSLAVYCAVPDSRGPADNSALQASLTAYSSPYKLKNSDGPAALRATDSNGMQLIHTLLSAQGDLISNSSTQKFLLSSLVANLREETERSSKMIVNLKKQNQELKDALEEAHRLGEEGSTAAAFDVVQEQDKRQALQDIVDRLTNELETRIKIDKQRRKEQTRELETLRETVTKLKSDARDGDIRLRHAHVGQADAEEQRDYFKAMVEALTAQVEALKKDRDDTRSQMRDEVIDRDRTISMLRIELAGRQQSTLSPVSRALDQRQLDEAQKQLVETVDRLRHQIIESEATVTELREENQSLKSDLTSVRESALHDQRQLEDELVDTRSELARARQSLIDADCTISKTRDELEETRDRLETIELELERLGDESKMRASKIQMHESAWNEHQSGMANLLESIAKMEDELASKDKQLREARQDLDGLRNEMDQILQARDVKLYEVETALSAKLTENETLVADCDRLGAKLSQAEALLAETNRLKETVATLRKQSADLKYQRLKKVKADQDDDILGLNIALEAKQQEASTWKRQLQAVRQSGGMSATPLSTTSTITATRSSRRVLSSTQNTANQVLSSSTGTALGQETPLPSRIAKSRPSRAASSSRLNKDVSSVIKPSSVKSSTQSDSKVITNENRAPARNRIAVPA